MQVIRTKYVGPTNTKPSRVIAENSGKSHRVVMSYDSAHSMSENHAKACRVLRAKLGWTKDKGYRPMYGGELSDGSTVWVFAVEWDKVDN